MKLIIAALFLIGSLSSCPAQRSVFFAQNRPVAAAAAAGITHVQGCQNYNRLGGQASITCTFAANVGVGHFIYMCAHSINTTVSTWSVGAGGTVTADPASADTIWAYTVHTSCAYVTNTAGGSATITATYGSSTAYPSITAEEFSGVALTFAADQEDSPNYVDNTSTPSSGSVTPVQSGELIIGYIDDNVSATITAGTGFTLGTNADGYVYSVIEYQVQATAGSIVADATISRSGHCLAHVATFKHP